MRFTYFFLLLNIFVFSGCKQEKLKLSKIEGKQIQITDSLQVSSEIDAFIKPYREHIQKDLDSVLAYSVNTYSRYDGEFNTAAGNLMADAVYIEANPIFKNRTGNNIDFVLLNIGSIRSDLLKGNVSKRSAFKFMPYENNIIVVALKGLQINNLITFLCKAKKAHPISK